MPGIMIRKANLGNYGITPMAIFGARSKLFAILSYGLIVFPYFLITGCVAPHPAPVVEFQKDLNQAIDKSPSKQTYIVQRGDTLYGIALRHGVDYRELAQWNGIVDPNALMIGQEIDLSVPSKQTPSIQQEKVMTAQPSLFSVSQPELAPETIELPSSIPQPKVESSADTRVTEPRGIKLPYSESAVAQLRNSADIPNNAPAKAETVVAMAPVTQKAVENESISKNIKNIPTKSEIKNTSNIHWRWPTKGQILYRYTEKSKGVTISGNSGQPVVASADGTVVYSGSGLRGYGKLIIVKHNDTYLSAYGHNSKILVREGQSVTQGQKIAEMGSTDSDIVKLHFEIRERGKPVDPLKFLSN